MLFFLHLDSNVLFVSIEIVLAGRVEKLHIYMSMNEKQILLVMCMYTVQFTFVLEIFYTCRISFKKLLCIA